MKKIFWFLVLFVFAGILKSQVVTQESAYRVAENCFSERLFNAKGETIFSLSKTPVVIEKDGLPTLYIFVGEAGPGYIIISADYAAMPVFGYSFESTFEEAILVPVFRDILEYFSQQIQYARAQKMIASEEVQYEWAYYSKPTFDKSGKDLKSLAPLLQTTWDQGCYYNDLCPVDPQGPCGRVWAGCVATAMAQVMKYHNWPPQGQGSNIYSTPNGYGTLSADFGATTYDWSEMPNALTAQTYNFEVARLLLHCGISVNMNYSWDGSGANTAHSAQSFIDYFRYAGYIAEMEKDAVPESLWSEILTVELHSERPVLYRGFGSGGGHAFVCDGYQGTTNKIFHFNLGWGGAANGYYSFSNVAGFSSGQAAILSVEPAYDGPQYCQEFTLLTAPTGTISDGSLDKRYANNTSCKWLIKPQDAGAILLQFEYLKTEPGLDRILVYEGENEHGWLIADISGFNVPSDPIVVSGGSMFIWFFSDEYNAAPGWQATYSVWATDLEEQEEPICKIFPNPAEDFITVQTGAVLNEEVTLKIFDAQGKVVQKNKLSGSSNSFNINVSELPAGSYTIVLYNKKQIITSEKLIIGAQSSR